MSNGLKVFVYIEPASWPGPRITLTGATDPMGRQTHSLKAAAATFERLFGFGYEFNRRSIEGISPVTALNVLAFARPYLPWDGYVSVIFHP